MGEPGLVVEVRLAAEEFPLGKVLVDHPDVRVELERLVPTEQGMMPFFWVIGDVPSFASDSATDDPLIEDVEVLGETDDACLCRTVWSSDEEGFYAILAERRTTLLEAEGRAETWLFRLRFPDHDATARFRDACDERGIEYEVRRVYSLSELPAKRYRLTGEQREALVAAFEGGYFRVPRQLSLSELAAELDISPQAASGRLRRGLERVLETALPASNTTEEEPNR